MARHALLTPWVGDCAEQIPDLMEKNCAMPINLIYSAIYHNVTFAIILAILINLT